MKNLVEKLWITALMLALSAILYMSPISCIVLELCGVPCPGCGMTRALLAALRLDFAAAFSHHFMFWSIPIIYLLFLLDGRLFKYRWMNVTLCVVIALGFLANWAVSLTFW